jgi:plastocyanin
LKADGNKQGGANAIGQATTTTVPVVITTAPATTLKNTPTTVAIPTAIYKIQDDNKGQYIDPLSHSVKVNSLVRFVNEDDTAHTITLKVGSQAIYNSPTIAPGGTWDLRPTARGTFDIVDNERTYAVGATLAVTA